MNWQSEQAIRMVMRNRMRNNKVHSQPEPFKPQVTGLVISDSEEIKAQMTVPTDKKHRVGDSLILIKENREDLANMHLFRILAQKSAKSGYSLVIQEEKSFINPDRKDKFLNLLLTEQGGK